MIKSFGCQDTKALFHGNCLHQWIEIRARAERKLTMIDSAHSLEFLRSPPGNRLESLKGKRKGQFSIRINDQWRVCFRWNDGNAFDVVIEDYH
jgi:proteic killer suppression protein